MKLQFTPGSVFPAVRFGDGPEAREYKRQDQPFTVSEEEAAILLRTGYFAVYVPEPVVRFRFKEGEADGTSPSVNIHHGQFSATYERINQPFEVNLSHWPVVEATGFFEVITDAPPEEKKDEPDADATSSANNTTGGGQPEEPAAQPAAPQSAKSARTRAKETGQPNQTEQS